jgi:hypothetical protein
LRWVQAPLEEGGRSRSTYIKSLQLADRGDYSAILAFARSLNTT